MTNLPVDDNSLGGFTIAPQAVGLPPVVREVSLASQLTGDSPDAQVNDVVKKAVAAVKTDAMTDGTSISGLGTVPLVPAFRPQVARPVVQTKQHQTNLESNMVFNVLAAFIAGLVVVGIVYAFVVSRSGNYSSETLGVKTQNNSSGDIAQ